MCVSDLTIIGSDNGLSPGRHQAIIWTNELIYLIGTLGTNVSKIIIELQTNHSRKCIWIYCLQMASILSRPQCVKVSSVKWWTFVSGFNDLIISIQEKNEGVILECAYVADDSVY